MDMHGGIRGRRTSLAYRRVYASQPEGRGPRAVLAVPGAEDIDTGERPQLRPYLNPNATTRTRLFLAPSLCWHCQLLVSGVWCVTKCQYQMSMPSQRQYQLADQQTNTCTCTLGNICIKDQSFNQAPCPMPCYTVSYTKGVRGSGGPAQHRRSKSVPAGVNQNPPPPAPATSSSPFALRTSHFLAAVQRALPTVPCVPAS
jgi:hypothetical protein